MGELDNQQALTQKLFYQHRAEKYQRVFTISCLSKSVNMTTNMY